MGISVIYFTNFQYNKAEEQRRVDPVVRTGPKSVLTLSRMVLFRFFAVWPRVLLERLVPNAGRAPGYPKSTLGSARLTCLELHAPDVLVTQAAARAARYKYRWCGEGRRCAS